MNAYSEFYNNPKTTKFIEDCGVFFYIFKLKFLKILKSFTEFNQIFHSFTNINYQK